MSSIIDSRFVDMDRVVFLCVWFAWLWPQIETTCSYKHNDKDGWTHNCSEISPQTDLKNEGYPEPNRYQGNEFTITNSSFPTFPANFFTQFPEIKRLFLEDNHIGIVQIGAFGNLAELKDVYLDKNEITKIFDDTFKNNSDLALLSLRNNNVTKINVAMFDSLRKFTHLDLSGNPIEVLENFSKSSLTNLQTLYLSNTSIREFNYDFADKELIKLNISCSRVETVDFSKFPSVKIADFSRNFIQNWTTSEFGTKMDILDISHNPVSVLKRNPFKGMVELRELYLKNTSLSSVPIDSFLNSNQLTTLDLSYNHITHFRFGTFSKLIHLQNLYVQHNQLTSILLEVSPLVGLVRLYIDHNNIDLNFEDVKLRSQNLREISFSHNSPWTCRVLAVTYQDFEKSGVSVVHGDSFDVENLHGIPCNVEASLTSSENGKEQKEQTNNKKGQFDTVQDENGNNTSFQDVGKSNATVLHGDSSDVETLNGTPCTEEAPSTSTSSENGEEQKELADNKTGRFYSGHSDQNGNETKEFMSSTVKFENSVDKISIILVIIAILLTIQVSCVGYILYYKVFVKNVIGNTRETISMHENCIP